MTWEAYSHHNIRNTDKHDRLDDNLRSSCVEETDTNGSRTPLEESMICVHHPMHVHLVQQRAFNAERDGVSVFSMLPTRIRIQGIQACAALHRAHHITL
jgi:hypothetical protein